MLTQLTTVKARLNISLADTTQDDLLTRAINAVSARFDHECNRTFARTVDATQEFVATEREIIAQCYPIEAVTKFEVKMNEVDSWVERTVEDYLMRQACVISLGTPLSVVPVVASINPGLGRVTYTGGYVQPGTTPSPGQTPLPSDLESGSLLRCISIVDQTMLLT